MERREFLIRSGEMSMGAIVSLGLSSCSEPRRDSALPVPSGDEKIAVAEGEPLTLFLAGDVMTGRGIDQILPHSVDPRLYEPHVKNAKRYVELAEQANGSIPDGVSHDYVWGDALAELARVAPGARIINLETAVTTSDEYWPGKRIHYRMHPANVPVITVAGIDVCVLGNNHVLDWGYAGLRETLEVLHDAGVRTAGAGNDLDEAAAPAVLKTKSGRLLVYSYGTRSSGVLSRWVASASRAGVAWLGDLERRTARRVSDHIRGHRRAGDRVVVSLHWGSNWNYRVLAEQRDFAHALVDAGAADIVHGHSSHHPKGIEVYRDRLILYGCGDLLNDYEGIGGRKEFRPELTAMYFPTLDASGALIRLEIAPMRVRRLRLARASKEEARWLATRLDRESRRLGTRVELCDSGRLRLARD